MGELDENIDLIWLNQTEDAGSEPVPEPSEYSLLWEDGFELAWEDGEAILLELDEEVETTAITLLDGQSILTESGEAILMEAA